MGWEFGGGIEVKYVGQKMDVPDKFHIYCYTFLRVHTDKKRNEILGNSGGIGVIYEEGLLNV